MTTKPGEVYLVDLGLGAKKRPMLVVSRKDDDAPRALALCVPLTTACRGSLYEIPVGKPKFLDAESWANVQAVQPMAHHELGKRLGVMGEEVLATVRDGLRFALEL